MKIATYNVASGGFKSYASLSNVPERLERLRKAIHEIDADVVGLTDTFRWKDIFSPKDIQEIFGYPHSFHVNMDDTRVDKRIGLAIVSRHPIVSAKAVRLYNRNAIKATITLDPNGRSIDIFVVYLDDLKETTRQRQVEALLAHVSDTQCNVVLGDFNAIWPVHVPKLKQQVNEFIHNNPTFTTRSDYKQLQATFHNFYKASALPLLQRHGFTEPIELRPTALTKLHPLAFPSIFPVDHILTKGCTAVDYLVYNNTFFEHTSDHYPLSATLKI